VFREEKQLHGLQVPLAPLKKKKIKKKQIRFMFRGNTQKARKYGTLLIVGWRGSYWKKEKEI
jgi:hypothetical protein